MLPHIPQDTYTSYKLFLKDNSVKSPIIIKQNRYKNQSLENFDYNTKYILTNKKVKADELYYRKKW